MTSNTSDNAEMLRNHFPAIWPTILEEWLGGEDPGYPTISTRYQAILQTLRPAGVLMDIVILEANNPYEQSLATKHLVEPIKKALSHRFNVEQKVTISAHADSDSRNPVHTNPPAHTDNHIETTPDHTPPQRFTPTPTSKNQNTPASSNEPTHPLPPERNLSYNNERNEFNDSWESFNRYGEQDNPQTPQPRLPEEPAEEQQKADTITSTPPVSGATDTLATASTTPASATTDNQNLTSSRTANVNSDTNFNSQYTFETFVKGPSNNWAFAACQAVAEAPGQAYNPLLIWGESGLGKTHLLHAIGQQTRAMFPHMRIEYITSEEMMNHFINAIEHQRMEAFKRRYRSLDMLIVDDIQFLQGKEQLQEEFFHMFNALQQNGKQIVLSSDRNPVELTTLEDRLRTRFSEGLTADVNFPNLETRIAIVHQKARSEGVEFPRDIAEMIATKFKRSVRELHGAVYRVVAYSSLSDVPLTMEGAIYAVKAIQSTGSTYEITPQIIIDTVAQFYDLSTEELTGKGKVRRIAQARQIAMYLCRELTEYSLVKIGEAFGGKDHTTVRHAERKVQERIAAEQQVFNELQDLTEKIKSNAAK